MTGATKQAEFFSAIREAVAAKRRLLAERAAKLKRAAELDATRREAEGAAGLGEAEQLAHESRILAEGGEIDARKAADFERTIKAATRRARAAEAAARKLRDEAAGMAPQIEAAEAAVANAALGAMRGIRDGGAVTARDTLDGMTDALAAVMAGDEVRRALIGDAYAFDVRQHPTQELWSGASAVAKLLDAIPSQLLPIGFKAKVESTARRIATETLAALNAETDHD